MRIGKQAHLEYFPAATATGQKIANGQPTDRAE